MQEVDEVEGYSDDDLDLLPIDAFQELQENAIQSSQRQEASEGAKLSKEYKRLSIKPKATTGPLSTAAGGKSPRKIHTSFHLAQPSSDYGDFDDEMLDGEVVDAALDPSIITSPENRYEREPIRSLAGEGTQREKWRLQGYPAQPQSRQAQVDYKLPQRAGLDDKKHKDVHPPPRPSLGEDHHEANAQMYTGSPVADRLKAQIEEVRPLLLGGSQSLVESLAAPPRTSEPSGGR